MAQNGQMICLTGEPADDIQRAAIAFIEDRIAKWSPEQAQAMYLRLNGRTFMTQSEMAGKLVITRQAVAARLHAAGYGLIEATIGAFQSHYDEHED